MEAAGCAPKVPAPHEIHKMHLPTSQASNFRVWGLGFRVPTFWFEQAQKDNGSYPVVFAAK